MQLSKLWKPDGVHRTRLHTQRDKICLHPVGMVRAAASHLARIGFGVWPTVPWYTRDAFRFISRLDLHGKRVLEYGSGSSTLWYARRGALVTTVEDDPDWITRVADMC